MTETTTIPWNAGRWTTNPVATAGSAGDLLVSAVESSDAWRNTYYGFVHDTEHALIKPWDSPAGMTVSFRLDFDQQFDQAGIFIRASETEWIKAGVEFSDGNAQLGAVVTHGCSDWSVAPVDEWHGRIVTVWASRHEDSIIIRAKTDQEDYRLVRVAHMPREAVLEAGPFCAAPSRDGLQIRFTEWAETVPEPGLH